MMIPQTYDELLRLEHIATPDGNVRVRAPRFHGDGIIQLYLGKHTRLHVYHPWLPPTVENSLVHDHAWDMHSRILLGSVEHSTYNIRLDVKGPMEVNEARDGCGTGSGILTKCYRCFIDPTGTNIFREGSYYLFPRHNFHETVTDELSMTVIEKSNYSDLPPRILAPWDEDADLAYGDDAPAEADLWRAIKEAYKHWEKVR